MTTLRLAAVALALSSVPTFAGSSSQVSSPLPVNDRTEVRVSVVNTCAGRANVAISVKRASNGAVFKSLSYSLAAGRGRTDAYKVTFEDILISSIRVTCDGSVTPSPLLSAHIAPSSTGVAQLSATFRNGSF